MRTQEELDAEIQELLEELAIQDEENQQDEMIRYEEL